MTSKHRLALLFVSLLVIPFVLAHGVMQPNDCPPTSSSPCKLMGHLDDISSIDFHPDGDLLATFSRGGGNLKLWELPSGTLSRTIELGRSIETVRFSPNGETIAIGGAGVELRRLDDFETIWRNERAGRLDIAFSPDGKMISAVGKNETIKLLDAATGDDIRTLRGHIAPILDLEFSPNGNVLASAAVNGTVKIWDVETGEELRSLREDDAAVDTASFGPEGEKLATVGGRQVFIWEVASGEISLPIRSQNRRENYLAGDFGPQGRLIAVSGQQGRTTVFDVSFGGFIVKRLREQRGDVDAVSFSPSGNLLATGAQDRTVMLTDVSELRE